MEHRCSRGEDHRGSHTDRGLNIFYKFSKETKTPHKIEIPLQKQVAVELTQEPVTLGDHLRRHRLELGLYQKDVSIQIGTTTSSIWNWENGSSIALRLIPKVIKFLGYNPILCPEDLVGRLAWYKLVQGLNLNRLGAEMKRDPEQLGDWLAGRHRPSKRNLAVIERFLSDHSQGPGAVQRSGGT